MILAIFDCDGVLIDSEPIACSAVAECLQQLGVPVSVSDILSKYTGISSPKMYADLELRYGIGISELDRQSISSHVEDRLAVEVQAMPGAVETLEEMAQNYCLCVASSSSHSRLKISLSKAGLLGFFTNRIFSAHDVSNGKPAPDLFLYASERLAFNPAQCVVIEDSIAGVKAACAAHMRCIGFVGGGHATPELAGALSSNGATFIATRFSQISEYF